MAISQYTCIPIQHQNLPYPHSECGSRRSAEFYGARYLLYTQGDPPQQFGWCAGAVVGESAYAHMWVPVYVPPDGPQTWPLRGTPARSVVGVGTSTLYLYVSTNHD